MKTLRILALTSLVAGFGLMTGCDTTSSTSGPTIKEFQIANTDGTGFNEATDSLAAGGSVAVWGEVTSDAGLSNVTVTVKDAAGATKLSLPNSTSATSYVFGPDKTVKITIATTTAWAKGKYSVQLTATDKNGNSSTSSSLPLLIKGGTTVPTGTAVTATTVTLGSNDNATYGSSIDADAMSVYKISQVTTALQGGIDAYYAYSSTDKLDKFFSPSQAKTSGFDGIKSWTVSTSVSLYNLGTMTATAFAAITTQEQIDALFTGKTSAVSVPAAADVVVGIKTSAGVYRVLHVDAITAGSTGTVTVKGYK